MVGSLALLGVALLLFTNLRADTDRPMMWLWMALAGLGIGPSFAVFTLIVQNAVSPDRIGVATSSLTFFQQIGGTVGLTLAGTILARQDRDRAAGPADRRGRSPAVPHRVLARRTRTSPSSTSSARAISRGASRR